MLFVTTWIDPQRGVLLADTSDCCVALLYERPCFSDCCVDAIGSQDAIAVSLIGSAFLVYADRAVERLSRVCRQGRRGDTCCGRVCFRKKSLTQQSRRTRTLSSTYSTSTYVGQAHYERVPYGTGLPVACFLKTKHVACLVYSLIEQPESLRNF